VTRPLRADAERNRERILRAADDLFTRRGLDVGLDEIARHAQVGVGTVYRRFRDRNELIAALLDDRIDRIRELTERAAAHPDPWTALVTFVESMVAMQVADRGLKEVIFGQVGAWDTFRERREKILPIAEAVLRRAQEAGVVRDDLELTDLAVTQLMLGQLGVLAAGANPDLWRRQLHIVLDGIRAERSGPTPLPVRALSFADFEHLCGQCVDCDRP
jgi:AcrR family transcriptional regulator